MHHRVYVSIDESFSLMIGLPPRSTLFPYTPLSRSTIGQPVRWLIARRDPWAGPHSKAWESHPVVQTRLFGDRKSTRLNSSHSQISYAVFCLKKKTHILHHM